MSIQIAGRAGSAEREPRHDTVEPNSYDALRRRPDAGTPTWRGPALMLVARSAWAVGAQAVGAQALVAAVFVLRSSPTPWRDAGPWLPVYGTLIDAGCLALLWWLTRREGIRLLPLLATRRRPPESFGPSRRAQLE
jgi:hypothetical protein